MSHPNLNPCPCSRFLQSVESVFKLNNRGTDPGEVRCEVVDDHYVKITLRVVTPDDLWYGIFYGYVRRFARKGQQFTVRYDPDVPRRDNGGSVTILHITWER